MEAPDLFATLIGRHAPLDQRVAESFVRGHYGIEACAERLTGERDENFWMRVPQRAGYVLKIASADDQAALPEVTTAALLHLEQTDRELPCPRVVRTTAGEPQTRLVDEAGASRTAVLYTFLPGKSLLGSARSSAQRRCCGRLLARLARALRGFNHPAARRTLAWDLALLPRLAELIPEVPGLPSVAFLAEFVERFAVEISPQLAKVRHQFVHNDFNARNVLVDPADESCVTGVIDFGDAVHTALVADIAVGVTGQLASPDTAEESIREFVDAYSEVEPLANDELAILHWLIAGRIVQNVVITSWHRAQTRGSAHFDAFDPAYFAWRIELAQRLARYPPTLWPL